MRLMLLISFSLLALPLRGELLQFDLTIYGMD